MADYSYKADDRPGLQKLLDAQRLKADPVGPAAPIANPAPSQAPSYPGQGAGVQVAVNPTASDAARDSGFVRPTAGPFSPSNLDPNAPKPVASPIVKPTPLATTNAAAAAPAATPAVAAATPSPPVTPGTVAQDQQRNPNIPVLATATAPPGPKVFSDGTGGIASTLDAGALDRLAKAPSLTRADAGAGGNIASEAAGGVTPILGSTGVGTARPQPDAFARAQAANALATANAQSDLASIANRDFRSVAGAAARNADVERESRGKAGEKDHAETIDALTAGATAGLKPAAENAAASITDAGQTKRAGIEAASAIQKAQIDKQQPGQQVPMADGTLGILGADGVVRPALGPDGKAVRPQQGKAPVDSAAFGKMLESNVNKLLGVDPVTGMIPDPENPGKQRQATAAELYKASTQARLLTNQQFGIADGAGATRPEAEESAKAKAPDEGEVRQDAQGNRAKWVNGKWVPQT